MDIAALVEWARTHGAEISSNIEFVQVGPDNYGARCTAATPEKATISLPPKLIVKLLDAVRSFGSYEPQMRALARTAKSVNAVTKLFLARERTNALSFYAPYLASLPTAVQINSPYVWPPEEWAQLQGSNLGLSLRANIAQLVEEWWLAVLALPDAMPKPDEHYVNMKFYYEHKFHTDAELHACLTRDDTANWTSFAAYLWALMVLKLRSFPAALLSDADPLDTCQPDVVMLLPVVDLLNHSPQADVAWSSPNGRFLFETHADPAAAQLYNNYGRKGNEELLLAYGFCLADNAADSVALKIKIPPQVVLLLEASGVQLPRLADYTTSVVGSDAPRAHDEHSDGVLFFVSKTSVPESLVQVFERLVRTAWEGSQTVRLQLSGLNHLRQALESKLELLVVPPATLRNSDTISTYLAGQKKVLHGAINVVKRMEKELLAQHKLRVLSLKSVYKKDVKFAQSLLVTMGVASYDDIVEQQLTDQVWLLYLVRCYNRKHYEHEEENYLPEWIARAFERMDTETEMAAAEVVQFQQLYEDMILPMNAAVPEIYNVGKWTVRELIVSTRLLDTVGFVRGKTQECLLVEPEA